MTAVMMSVLKDVLTWTTEDLNAVLLHGDELYTSMRLQGKINDPTGFGHVSVAELPRVHTLNKTTFTIKHGESFSGVIGVDFYDESLRDVSMSIEEALQRALLQCDSCLLNIKEYICAIIKAGSTFAIINPHSYNAKGMPECDGTSIVVYCDDVYMLFNHVVNLAMSLDAQGTPFEVTSVKAMVIGKTTTMETSSKSGQEGSVSHISPTITVEDSKCIGDHDKPEDKVASILHVSPTSTVEDSKCLRDHGSETNIASETDNVSQIDIASETTNASDTAIASEPAETADDSGTANASQMDNASETADASKTAIAYETDDDSGIANAS
ncbi:replicase helicase endonuclease [Labeo rohita]|uniref:Replicase helicase endonuclease n=1 Tax=Labeo rohita TaxID=84645 RepID=A0A498P4F9_LABRO|nr:replicase helicase endonuclease [Labeo rohita]